ncbi:MAG: tetratricopeptide repeat protein [Pyrinomonadaceae bacterium]
MFTRAFVSLFLCVQISLAGLPEARAAAAPPSAPPVMTVGALPQPGEARLALARGKALLKRGNADQALGVLNTALRLFQQADDEKGAAAAQDALGDLYHRQGQYGAALDYYQKAYTAFHAESDPYNADLMLAKTGDMQYQQGKVDEALQAYNRMDARKPNTNALNAYKSARSKATKARGLFDRVRSIATNTPTTSTADATTSIAKDAAGEVKSGFNLYRQYIIYSIHELGLGRIDFANDRLESAKTHFQNALDAAGGGDLPVIGKLGQTRRFRVASRTNLGDIAFRQNRFTDAVKLYTDAASGAQSDNRLDLMWPAQRGLGRSRWVMSQQERDAKKSAKIKDEAIHAYRAALKTIETIRSGSLRADDARSTFIATTKDVFDEASSALAEMALASAGASLNPLTGSALAYAAESFGVVEQGRARSLLDMLAESRTIVTEGLPADLVNRKQENLDRQQEIAQSLTGVSFGGEAPEKPVSELEIELDRLASEYDQIENQIRVAHPRYGALMATQPATLAAVQQQVLDPNTVLLEYSLGAESSYLWAVSSQRVSLFKLAARATVDKLAIDLRAQLIPAQLRRQIAGINVAADDEAQRGLGLGAGDQSRSAASAYAATAHALYQAVVEPVAAELSGKRLLIVADGALNYVPFEALVSSPAGASYDALPYLVQTHEIVYAPSSSVVTAVRQSSESRTAASAGGAVLLVADPVFEGSDPRNRPSGSARPSPPRARKSIRLPQFMLADCRLEALWPI